MPRDDHELARVVRSRLARDPGLAPLRLRVSAVDGHVRLAGTVPHLALRREAIRLAAGERGVLSLEEALEIAGPPRADRALAMDVRQALARHADLVPPRLEVAVERGTAHATGEVRTVGRYLFLRERLETITGLRDVDLAGVSIESRRVVRTDDETLRDAIVALLRDPYRFPVSGRIDVETREGTFVLTGTVPRLIDRLEALEVAGLVVDAGRLRNELQIDPTLGRLQIHEGAVPGPR